MENKDILDNAQKESRNRIAELIQEYCDGSQQRFVEKTGLKKSAVSQYVNGKRTITNLAATKIAATFNVSPTWVMGFSTEKEMNILEYMDAFFQDESQDIDPSTIREKRLEKLTAMAQNLTSEQLEALISLIQVFG